MFIMMITVSELVYWLTEALLYGEAVMWTCSQKALLQCVKETGGVHSGRN